MPALERLWLYRNGIRHIACDAFDGLSGLTILDLSDNPLRQRLPATVRACRSPLP